MSHPLLERLASGDPAERVRACCDAAADPSAVLLISALGETLADREKQVARAASDALVELGRRESGVGEVLRTALLGDHPGRRFWAAYTSARLSPPGPKLVPALVEALAFPSGDLRWAAARLLVDVGRLTPEILPLLLGLVRADERAPVRRMATFCLRELAPERPEAASVLLEATRDDDEHVRRAALSGLLALEDPPEAVVARLVEAATCERDAPSRRIAALALGELGARGTPLPREALEALRSLSEGAGDETLRRAAALALERSAAR